MNLLGIQLSRVKVVLGYPQIFKLLNLIKLFSKQHFEILTTSLQNRILLVITVRGNHAQDGLTTRFLAHEDACWLLNAAVSIFS